MELILKYLQNLILHFLKEIETHYGLKFKNKNKNKSPILMIEDNIKTDIQFAKNLNIYSCLFSELTNDLKA